VDLFGLKKRKKRRELWARIAAELGGSFHLAKGFWRPTNERIEATVGGVPLVLDTYVVQSGNTQHPYTRVYAKLALGPGLKLQIAKRGMLTGIGNMFRDDVVLGHTGFDELFVVRCEQPAVARRLLTPTAAGLMLATFRDGKLTCDDMKLKLVTPGIWTEEQRLRDGMTIISELAARDLYGFDTLRTVEGGTLGIDQRGWPTVAIAAATRVVIGADAHDGRMVMVARTSEPCPLEPMQLEITGGAARDSERVSRLPPGAHVALRGVGTGMLEIAAEGTSFRWRELELDAQRLRAAADLLGAIAAAPHATEFR